MNLPAKKFYTILGIDPGKTNCAYSVVRIKVKPFKFKILAHGMLKKPLNDLTGFEVETRIKAFKSEVRKIKNTYKVDFVIAERFMTRGGQSMGTTIEVVSGMLMLLAHVGIKKFMFITAAQWKNQWNKHNDLKQFYKTMHPIPAHPIDATGIALYGASQLFNEIPCFAALNNIKQLIKQIQESNKEPLNAKRSNSRKDKGSAAPSRPTRKRTPRAQQTDTPRRSSAAATKKETPVKKPRATRTTRATRSTRGTGRATSARTTRSRKA